MKKNEVLTETIFPNRFRHTIFFKNKPDLLIKLIDVFRPNVTNAIKIDEEIFFHLRNEIITSL